MINDNSEHIAESVKAACTRQQPLRIAAGGTKAFLGEATTASESLDVSTHRGIINYDPGELVVTVRAGTPLAELQATLAAQHQQLAFEPPHFGANATIGGTIAAGLSGPARPYAGAARDFVLGSRIVNGRGETLRLGGEVMKNVAGYDLSRLMTGAFGTLGVLLDISMKVLPAPRAQLTLMRACDAATAITQFNSWARKPWPITAAYWEDGHSYVRLAGAEAAVNAARQALGGEAITDDAALWHTIREHERPHFQGEQPLWRLAVAPATPLLAIAGVDDAHRAVDWGGAQRWLTTSADADHIRATARDAGGHASLWRGEATPRFHPLPPALMTLQRNVKQSLDPVGILNPGRLYPDL